MSEPSEGPRYCALALPTRPDMAASVYDRHANRPALYVALHYQGDARELAEDLAEWMNGRERAEGTGQ